MLICHAMTTHDEARTTHDEARSHIVKWQDQKAHVLAVHG